jgi:hypothetical protein
MSSAPAPPCRTFAPSLPTIKVRVGMDNPSKYYGDAIDGITAAE